MSGPEDRVKSGPQPLSFYPMLVTSMLTGMTARAHANADMGRAGADTMFAFMTEPWKVGLRCQAEMMGLVSRRSQAALKFPTQLTQCRSPYELWGAHIEFGMCAFEDLADTTARITTRSPNSDADEVLTSSAVVSPLTARDYLAISEQETPVRDKTEVEPKLLTKKRIRPMPKQRPSDAIEPRVA